MKNIILYIFLGLSFILDAQAQYNYQIGNLQVNNTTFKVSQPGFKLSVENLNNNLHKIIRSHPILECGEAHFSRLSWVKIEDVFCKVFPITRRAVFDKYLFIFSLH